MRALTTMVMVGVLISAPAFAAQKETAAADRLTALKAMAGSIPLGSRVKLQVREGRRLTATLMQVTDEAIVVQRLSRIPETPVTVRFDELAVLRLEERSGFTVGKAIGIGLAAGVGAILTMFGIAMVIDD